MFSIHFPSEPGIRQFNLDLLSPNVSNRYILLQQAKTFCILLDITSPRLPQLSHWISSLSAGVIPAAFKSADICPLLKKPDLDTTDTKNYRPIWNATVVSKLLERVVARQLFDYLSVNKLLPDREKECIQIQNYQNQ